MNTETRKEGVCPKCKNPMERRRHGANKTACLMKPYHYSEWDYCKRCKHLQHYEKYKVSQKVDIGLGFL